MSAFLSILLLLATSAGPNLAVPGQAAVVRPLVEPAARCSASPRLVVAITAFTPPRQGASTLVISVRTRDGRTTRLGEVGIYPHQPFTASLADARRFGFAMPRRMLGEDPSVTVAVEADGDAAGARAVVGEARVTPAPQERCQARRR